MKTFVSLTPSISQSIYLQLLMARAQGFLTWWPCVANILPACESMWLSNGYLAKSYLALGEKDLLTFSHAELNTTNGLFIRLNQREEIMNQGHKSCNIFDSPRANVYHRGPAKHTGCDLLCNTPVSHRLFPSSLQTFITCVWTQLDSMF